MEVTRRDLLEGGRDRGDGRADRARARRGRRRARAAARVRVAGQRHAAAPDRHARDAAPRLLPRARHAARGRRRARQAAVPDRRAPCSPHYRIPAGTAAAYALTPVDFTTLAARYGRIGGYAHLATLIKRVRAERPSRTLLLDGGDALQGSATALWSRGEDMVRAQPARGGGLHRALGVHLRHRAGEASSSAIASGPGASPGDFIAQNVSEAGWGDRMFRALHDARGGRRPRSASSARRFRTRRSPTRDGSCPTSRSASARTRSSS